MIYSKYIVSEEFDVVRNCKQTEEFYILIHTIVFVDTDSVSIVWVKV